MKRGLDAYEHSVGTVLLGVAVVWIAIAFRWRADAIFSETFLWGDGAHNLVVCQQLLSGKLFFRDVFSQYGPLPSYVYAGIAVLFGNTVRTYMSMVALLTVVDVWMIWILLRRNVSWMTALIVCLVGVFPVFLLPGSFTAGYPETIYYGFERAGLLLAVILWRPAVTATFTRALLLGLCLGFLQTIKFGSCFVLGLAIIAVDVGLLCRTGMTRETLTRWARSNVAILLGFAVVEATLAVVAFASMPEMMAKDFLWPSYMLEGYSSYVTAGTRGFQWMGVRFFVVRQLGPVCALLMAGTAAIGLFSPSLKLSNLSSKTFPARLLILTIFYLIALFVYLKQIWLIYAYVWVLLLSVSYAFEQLNRWWRGVFVAASLPCLWVNLKCLSPNQRAEDVSYHIVARDMGLWLSRKAIWRVDSLKRILWRVRSESGPSQNALMIVPGGSGLHLGFGVPPVSRHTWFLVGVIRSYDEGNLLDAIDRCFAVVCLSDHPFIQGPSKNPALWPLYPNGTPFGSDLGKAIAEKLDGPIEVDDGCWIFPVKHRTLFGDNVTAMQSGRIRPQAE